MLRFRSLFFINWEHKNLFLYLASNFKLNKKQFIMSKTKNNGAKKTAGGFSAIVAFLAMALALVAGIMIYK